MSNYFSGTVSPAGTPTLAVDVAAVDRLVLLTPLGHTVGFSSTTATVSLPSGTQAELAQIVLPAGMQLWVNGGGTCGFIVTKSTSFSLCSG